MNQYAGLYIFEDGLTDEQLEGVLGRAVEELTRLGGEVTRTEKIGRRTFARPMDKRTSGVYYRLYFTLAPDQVSPLLARYKLAGEVFRIQIVVAEPERERKGKKDEAAAEAAAE